MFGCGQQSNKVEGDAAKKFGIGDGGWCGQSAIGERFVENAIDRMFAASEGRGQIRQPGLQWRFPRDGGKGKARFPFNACFNPASQDLLLFLAESRAISRRHLLLFVRTGDHFDQSRISGTAGNDMPGTDQQFAGVE